MVGCLLAPLLEVNSGRWRWLKAADCRLAGCSRCEVDGPLVVAGFGGVEENKAWGSGVLFWFFLSLKNSVFNFFPLLLFILINLGRLRRGVAGEYWSFFAWLVSFSFQNKSTLNCRGFSSFKSGHDPGHSGNGLTFISES